LEVYPAGPRGVNALRRSKLANTALSRPATMSNTGYVTASAALAG